MYDRRNENFNRKTDKIEIKLDKNVVERIN